MIEGRLLADQSMHAPHARREVGVVDVQFVVGRELALVAIRTQIPRARDFHLAQGGQDTPRAQFAVTCLLAAGTRKRTLWFGRLAKAQQVAEGGGAGMMQGSAEGQFHRLQIRLAGLLALGEDACQQRGYFARDLVLDGLGRFFSCGVSLSSTGRARQSFSLTATKDRSSWRYLRKVSISRSVLCWAVGVAKLSVTVLPSTLYVKRGCGRWPASSGR